MYDKISKHLNIKYIFWLLAGMLGILVMAVPLTADAQDARTPGPSASPGMTGEAILSRSSPFDPPAKDAFVTDSGPGLDTGCTFKDDPENPLTIDIAIDKFVGDVDGGGFLINPAPLIAKGIIPATIDIVMPAYDVDFNGSPPPERDIVFFNGQNLGFLTGDNNIWKLNTFSIDIRKVKFPARPAPGAAPVPVVNRVQISIDTISSTPRWCTAIDWVALIIPIRPQIALEIQSIAGNRIRENDSERTIETIYKQSFDAACNVQTDIGSDFDKYPFSGPAQSGLFGWFTGEAKLRTRITTCPENSIDPPAVKAEWTVASASVQGSTNWTGFEGDIVVKIPDKVDSYTVDFTYTVNGTAIPKVSRKLFVTKSKAPENLGTPPGPPRLSWYEKATDWASGQSDDAAIIKGVLDGLYAFGRTNWRYGYNFVPPVGQCTWEQLVADPIKCNYSDCYIFSEVLDNISQTLGIGVMKEIAVYGSEENCPSPVPGKKRGCGFLTKATPSLDPAFPGSARPLGGGAYNRYVFSSHSLRQRGWLFPDYYDATFKGTYGNQTQFIDFNMTGKGAKDATGRKYATTAEGARIYGLPGLSYDSWGNYEYALPVPPAPAPIAPMTMAAASTDLQFPGTASYRALDTNGDGIYEGVAADIDVEVSSTGTYSIEGQLERNGEIVANRPANESQLFSRATFQASAPGVSKVTLTFSGEQIYQSGLDGPYDLVLDGISISGDTEATLQTPAYNHLSFGEVLTTITGVGDEGVDENSDGKLEGIRANVDVNGRAAGSYRLLGSLIKNGTTLVNADATVTIAAGQQTISLVFPGLPLKRSGQDGPYEGTVSLLDGNGHSVSSFAFLTKPYRASDFAVVIEPDGRFSDRGIDTNGNGLFDVLRIDLGVTVSEARTVLLTGALQNSDGSATVIAEKLVNLAPTSQLLTLDFSGPSIYDLQMNGPYRVEFSLRDPATQQEIDRVQAPRLTASYAFTSFDPTLQAQPIALSGASSDRGIDTDGDGLFNQLQVDVGIRLPMTDIYEWSARLVDKKGTEIGFYTRRAQLTAGAGTLNFVFDGERIGRNGSDGPYFIKSLLIFGQAGGNLVATDVAETQAYAASAFEGFQPRIEGDLNGDGKVDQADIALFQQAYGSVRGDPNYNPAADFDADGRITIVGQ